MIISVDKPDPIPLLQLAIPGYNFYVNFDYNTTNLGKSGQRGTYYCIFFYYINYKAGFIFEQSI